MESIALLLLSILTLEIGGQINLTPSLTCKIKGTICPFVIGGCNSTAEDAPWNAVIERKEKSKPDRVEIKCGGNIVSPTIILTTAECVAQRNPYDLNIYVGITSITQTDRNPLEVKSIILHPGWNTTGSIKDNLYSGHDLAIIVLQRKLQFNSKVRHICLPDDKLQLYSGQHVSLNGFGSTKAYLRIRAERIQHGITQIQNKDECVANILAIWPDTEPIPGDLLCAYSDSTSGCRGDGGGGLVALECSAPVLVGIYSFGIAQRSCSPNSPEFYTNVITHVPWIQQIFSEIDNTEIAHDRDSLCSGQTCKIKSPIRPYVVGGYNATAEDAPWHAVLELKTKSKSDRIVNNCGGNILSPTIILTAAHCVWGNKRHPYRKDHWCPENVRNQKSARECHRLPGGCPKGCTRVRPRDLNIYVGVTSIRQQERIPLKVKGIILHPGWNKTSMTLDTVRDGHDLAILVLQTELEFNPKVQNISLPSSQLNLLPGQDVVINGLGYVTTDGYVGTPAERLQSGNLQIQNQEACFDEYAQKIRGDQLCACSDNTDSCSGDSGSGLIKFERSKGPVLVGTVSFGSRFCKDVSGVYTNVGTHVEWIQQTMSDIVNTGDSSCSSSTVCIAATSCDWYNDKKNQIKGLQKKSPVYRSIVSELKESVCNKEDRKICCP